MVEETTQAEPEAKNIENENADRIAVLEKQVALLISFSGIPSGELKKTV